MRSGIRFFLYLKLRVIVSIYRLKKQPNRKPNENKSPGFRVVWNKTYMEKLVQI